MWVPCYARTHCLHAYVYLCCLHKHSWFYRVIKVYMAPSTCLELCINICKNGFSTWQYCLVMRYKAPLSPGLRSTVASLLLLTFDIFFKIYFQALMWWSEYGWGVSLWGPRPGPHSCDQALHGVAFGLVLWGPVWEQRADLQPARNARHLKSDLLKKNEGW